MDPALRELMEGDGGEEVEAIVRLFHPDTVPRGLRLVAKFENIATCRLRRDKIREVWSEETVASLKAPRLLDPGIETVSAGLPGPAPENISYPDNRRPRSHETTGRGVVVGIVDWGCDFAHPNFLNEDGTTRLLALWDQGAETSDKSPDPYGYGAVYDKEDINRALRDSQPYEYLGYHPADSEFREGGTHGTHVGDIAAGSGRPEGSPPGVAPGADIVFVHLATRGTGGLANLGDSVRILEAIDFISQKAGNKPMAINLSVGRTGGPHTGDTLVEQGMDAFLKAKPGRAIVQSTGNYFNTKMHAAGQLGPGQSQELNWITDKADITPNEMEIWYPGVDALTIEIFPPGNQNRFRASLGEKQSIHINGKEVGRIYHRAHDPNNGKNHIDIFLYKDAPAGQWNVLLKGEDIVDGRFHAWVERDAGCMHCQSRFSPEEAVPTTTIGTIANGFHTITVGAYDPHSVDMELAPFSSSGPTADGRQKPNLVAPGVNITAARSAPRNQRDDTPMLTGKSGTSMAAPHVTGTVALMFEAAQRPLRIGETRRLLLANTRKDATLPGEKNRIGSGYLDIDRAIEAAFKFAGQENKNEIKGEVTMNINNNNSELNEEMTPEIEPEESKAAEEELLEQQDREALDQFSEEDFMDEEDMDSEKYDQYDEESLEEDVEIEASDQFDEEDFQEEEEMDSEKYDQYDEESLEEDVEIEASDQLDEEEFQEEEDWEDSEIEDFDEDVEYEDDTFDEEGEDAYSEVESFGTHLVEMADEAISSGKVPGTADSLLRLMLSKVGTIKPPSPFNGESNISFSPALIFDAFSRESNPGLRRYLEQFFEVIASPGEQLKESLQPGDILVRRALGEDNLAQLFMLVTGTPIRWYDLESAVLSPESSQEGLYVHVIEAFPGKRSIRDHFARWLGSAVGNVGTNHIVLRVKTGEVETVPPIPGGPGVGIPRARVPQNLVETVYSPGGGRVHTPSTNAGIFRCAPNPVGVTPATHLPDRTNNPDAAIRNAFQRLGLSRTQINNFNTGGGFRHLRPIAAQFGASALEELLRRLRYSLQQIERPPHTYNNLRQSLGFNHPAPLLAPRLLLCIPGHFRELARRAPNAHEAFALENLGWLIMKTLRSDINTATNYNWWLPPDPPFVTYFANPIPALSSGVQGLIFRWLFIDTLKVYADYYARFRAWETGLAGRQWKLETGVTTSTQGTGQPFYTQLVNIPPVVNISQERAGINGIWQQWLNQSTNPLSHYRRIVRRRYIRNASLRGVELVYQFPSRANARSYTSKKFLRPIRHVFEQVFQTIYELGWNDLVFQTAGTFVFRAIRNSPNRLSNHGRGTAIDLNHFENRRRRGNNGSMDPRIVALFEAFNFRWGRCFPTADPMHFEYR